MCDLHQGCSTLRARRLRSLVAASFHGPRSLDIIALSTQLFSVSVLGIPSDELFLGARDASKIRRRCVLGREGGNPDRSREETRR